MCVKGTLQYIAAYPLNLCHLSIMQEKSVHVFVKTSYFLFRLVHCRHSAVCSSVVQSQCTCPYVNYTTCAVTNVCTVVCRTFCACCYQNIHVDVNRMQDKKIHISCMTFYGSGLSPSIPPTNIDTSQSASISSHSSYNILWTPSHLIALDYIITLIYECLACSRDTCIDTNH